MDIMNILGGIGIAFIGCFGAVCAHLLIEKVVLARKQAKFDRIEQEAEDRMVEDDLIDLCDLVYKK